MTEELDKDELDFLEDRRKRMLGVLNSNKKLEG